MAYTEIVKGQPDWDKDLNSNFENFDGRFPTDTGWLDGTKLTIGANATTSNFVYRIIKVGGMKLMYFWGDFTIQSAIYKGTWGSASSILFNLPTGYTFSKATSSVYRYHDQNNVSSPLTLRPYGNSNFIVDTTSSTTLSSYPDSTSIGLTGYFYLAD